MSLVSIKAGDWIKVQVTEVDLDRTYPIRCGEDLSFTLDGSYCQGFNQIAFPLEQTERWMMVSEDEKVWRKRKVFMTRNDKFIAWSCAENDKEVLNATDATGWEYAKEIETKIEFNLELSLEEIAEKFGVNVNQIKIKK
jgi:hypothetical protein